MKDTSDAHCPEGIDRDLYSRQLYTIGLEAMKKISGSNVLIVGLSGLGVEVAKNVILTGVKSVTLHDNKPASWMDIASQFYLKETSIGKNRVSESIRQLAELNKYVTVRQHAGDITEQFLQQFNVVVFTDSHIAQLAELSRICHRLGVKFIATESRGVFGSVFVDFGADFEVTDSDGEPPIQRIVVDITCDENGTVSVHDDERHGFQDGDFVTFTDVNGMTELNACAPRKIKVTGPYTFNIGSTSSFHPYVRGGYVTQAKLPVRHTFLSLEESLAKPELLLTDFAKEAHGAQLHIGFQALGEFSRQHQGTLPRPYNQADAEEVLTIARSINEAATVAKQQQAVENINEDLLRKLSFTASGNINSMAAFLGGIAAQEVQKACTGKFTPLKQWLYFDAIEMLPDPFPTEEDCQPLDCRYDAQIIVFGRRFQERLGNIRNFVVGAGALGCEFLKNFALMGLGCGPRGKVIVTDMDAIEISNLNRQFLFRQHHVGKLKSVVAAQAARDMNSQLNIEAMTERVGKETEDLFDDQFWEGLDVVTNALDNVQARLYVDSRCVYYRRPLLESGTLGTKGNVQVVVPFLTESYGVSNDPPEKSFPSCTIKNFPSMIEHTISWSKDLFGGLFTNAPTDANAYLSKSDFIESLDGSKRGTIESIHENLVFSRPVTFADCVVWARLKFEDLFNHKIRQLLSMFPLDAKTSTGAPFWSGPKRPPTPIEFDQNDPAHLDFIISAANLRAFVYGLKGEREVSYFRPILTNVMVPEFTFNAKLKIQVDEKEGNKPGGGSNDESMDTSSSSAVDGDDDDTTCSQLLKDLEKLKPSLSGVRLNPIEFEKDDDTNFHVDFITATSNLRARNYQIPEADRHVTKGIAGKIIPAMVTTTALVTGLVCMEMYKVLQGKKRIEEYRNAFINIALPFITLSEPIPPAKSKYYDIEWSQWDRFDVDVGEDLTLGHLLEYFQKQHRLEITMLSCGVANLYAFFMGAEVKKNRKNMKMSDLVKTVSKCDFTSKQKYLNFEILCNNEEGDDVDVPPVRFKFRHFGKN